MSIVAEVIYLVAIAHVWARGSIFKSVRTLGALDVSDLNWLHPLRLYVDLADCPLCSGVWIGALGHLAFGAWPVAMSLLGLASLVGSLSLAVYGAIRRI